MLPFHRHTAQEAPFLDIIESLRRVLGPSIGVRKATQADDARIYAFLQSVRREFSFPAEPEAFLDSIDSHYDGREGILVLLEKEGELVGTFGAMAHGTSIVELQKIYLAPALRGQGLGSTIFHCFMGLCLRLGYPSVVLETHPCFKVANRFYQSVGFRPARIGLRALHSGTKWLRYHFSEQV